MKLFMKKPQALLLATLLLPLSGCAVVDWMTYKLPISQGNIVDQKDVDKLKPGMTREQVVFVLGEPLARSSFANNRWEYMLTSRTGGGAVASSKRLTVVFDGDQLVGVAGDFNAPEGLATVAP